MKPQDILFIIIFLGLLWKRNNVWFATAGIICLVLAIPLFFLHIFFTAERLVWYAFAFFLVSALIQVFFLKRKKK